MSFYSVAVLRYKEYQWARPLLENLAVDGIILKCILYELDIMYSWTVVDTVRKGGIIDELSYYQILKETFAVVWSKANELC
jgi:hypothetical protein